MKRTTLALISVAVSLLAIAGASQAARVLYVDAAAPGADPANTWMDNSASAYDFANEGATYSAANQSYVFTLDSSMVGTGNEAIFDFDTEMAGAGLGTSFTIIAYINSTWRNDAALSLVTKTDEPGTGQFTGWALMANQDSDALFDMMMQPGSNQTRMYTRTGEGMSGAPMLLAITLDGSGTPGGTQWYVNGPPTATTYTEDGLVGSILNDNQVRLAKNGAMGGQTGWEGEMYFLEIYDTALSADDIAARWNSGSPARVPEPATMTLLAIAAVALLRRRQRA